MSEEKTPTAATPATDGAAEDAAPRLDQGTYEILRARLEEHASRLGERAGQLNQQRTELFGGSELEVIGNERIRTDNNSVPRDIIEVGELLLFGYNVFIGLKRDTRIDDVFSLYRFAATEDGFAFQPVATDEPGNFLAEKRFVGEFHELYRYYKDTRLLQLMRSGGRIVAVFQIGAGAGDLKAFRWAVSPAGEVTYLDNRGERDHLFPPAHDFEWTETSRDDHVLGRHPHISILDLVFVETVGGDLTVKVEDNTEDGRGIYREPVDEPNQSLADATVRWAQLGVLILIEVLPYKEAEHRYLVFNTRTQTVVRLDAIGQACQQLPEDHGIVFPGGYTLQSGEVKAFDGEVADMEFLRRVRSPNGEDVLYVFHERQEGRSILLPYNLIRKEVQNPIHCHGYSLFSDGRLVVFRADSDEPTRVHPMQIWQTPFTSDEHAAAAPASGSFLDKVGNAELVRGISDAFSLRRMVDEQQPSAAIYEELIAAATRAADNYYWYGHQEVGDLGTPLGELRASAELIIDEFEKVEALRRQARAAVDEAESTLEALWSELRHSAIDSIDPFVEALAGLRRQRGHLISLQEVRYADLQRIAGLEARVLEEIETLSGRATEFLLADDALAPYHQRLAELAEQGETATKASEVEQITTELAQISANQELLTEVVSGLDIDDATVRTQILESISEVLATLNRARALVENRHRELRTEEGKAEFGAQFKLFAQAVTGALGLAGTPEKCDAQLAKLMLQLEELESRFGELDEFTDELATKREEVYEAFSSRKQTLLDQRQRQAGRLLAAAERILSGVTRRGASFESTDQLNAYFASDAMVEKLRDLGERLRGLGESVRAEELASKLKSAREDAARAMRDRRDIFEDGATVIKLGRHRFSVNTQPFDLTLVPRGESMAFYLTGTDFHAPIDDPAIDDARDYWHQLLISENDQVYRGEYLASEILRAAEQGDGEIDLHSLSEARLQEGGLLELVRRLAGQRYDEGYERGVHDHDAARILEHLVELRAAAGLLRFAASPRAAAALFWAELGADPRTAGWHRRARSLTRLRETLRHSPAIGELTRELAAAIATFHQDHRLELAQADAHTAGAYLFAVLGVERPSFVLSADAQGLIEALQGELGKGKKGLLTDLEALGDALAERRQLATAWLGALIANDPKLAEQAPALDEAVTALLTDGNLERHSSVAQQSATVEGLLGQHPRIKRRCLPLRLDELLARTAVFRDQHIPGFRRFQELRHRLLEEEKQRLRLDEFRPRVMSAFVRNQLINDVYLPLVGDNLAKQLGATGEDKRTDQMGLLLLISPPGYGKTTLMEYIANRLGLVFVKINGPALGHGVTSLDPAEAPNATARQEVEKISFALEMGNNVLLYLDDIQHTHPELLQKFISLCDAQRRMEGVWRDRARTYDLRGKRFAITMAGNPYTESGDKFQIPDMLANRADVYNLGDVLAGKGDLFALSFLENALTSNPVLAPLGSRERGDIAKLVRMAGGDSATTPDQLDHPYSAVELEEVLSVLSKLLRVREVLLAVNRQYIDSAAQDDAYRTEPKFQLQGSYRNMNKLAEKVVPVMNQAELEALIDDHYQGEAQTLTSGAEANLLKLAELRGHLTPEQSKRWEEIKRGFARVQAMGGDDDPTSRVVGQLSLMSEQLGSLARTLDQAAAQAAQPAAESTGPDLSSALEPWIKKLDNTLTALAEVSQRPAPETQVPAPIPPAVDLKEIQRLLDHGLKGLGSALQSAVRKTPIAAAPRGGQVIQTLGSGVLEILTRMVSNVDSSLLPAVQALAKSLKAADGNQAKRLRHELDKTLKNLDMLKDLLAALRKIDTGGLAGAQKASKPRDQP